MPSFLHWTVSLPVLPERWFLLAALKVAGLCSQDNPKPEAYFFAETHFTSQLQRSDREYEFVSFVLAENLP